MKATNAVDQTKVRRTRTRRGSWIGAASLAVTVLLYLGVCTVILSRSLRTLPPCEHRTPLDFGLAGEELHFESTVDSIPLAGWLLPSSGDRAIVMVHGKDSDCLSGAQPDIAQAYVEAGFHVLLFDLRAHGRSGGKVLGLGWHERRDVRGAVNLLLERGFEPGRIGIHGGSYGGAVALLSAAAIPELGGVVADASFADVRDLIDTEVEETTGIPAFVTKFLLRPGIILMARIAHSLELEAVTPERAVPGIAPRPVFFIHGSEDRRIPVEHSKRLKAASSNPADELWVYHGGHTEAVGLEGERCELGEVSPIREEYLSKVVAFFDRSLR